MHRVASAGLGVALLFLMPSVQAQTLVTSTAPEQSDSQAVAVVEQAITVMGGREAWRRAGGATAQAVIAPEGLPTQTVNWSDDWAKGRVRFRRDSAASEPSKSSLISSDTSQMHLMPTGKIQAIQRDNGIAVLAIGYPAAALILSGAAQYLCTFRLGKPVKPPVVPVASSPDEVAVTERCPELSYPGGAAILTWTFSKTTGLPISVELPIWGQIQHVVRTQTISYIAFQSVDRLSVPSQLKIRRVSGAVDQVTVSNSAFVQGICDETFKTTK